MHIRSVTMLAVVTFAAPVLAQIPRVLGYQGRLLRADGTAATGTASVTFTVHDSASGGSLLWTETQTLGLSDGYYSTFLGLVTTPDDGDFDGGARWLQVQVGGETLLPRQQIGSVAFALQAASVRGSADVSSLKVDGQTIIDSAGRLQGAARYTGGEGIAVDASQVVSLQACAAGQSLVHDATGWTCATPAAGTVTGVDAVAPLSVTDGSTTPRLSMTQAGSLSGGYLSSTDWSGFQAKFGAATQCGGDLTGYLAAPVVARLQSRAVAAAAPTNGQVLKWSDARTQWEPAADADSGGTLTGLTGHAPLTVWGGATAPDISIQQATGASDGYLASADFARFDAKWDAAAQCGGDLSGPLASATVTALRSRAVSADAPAAGQVLRWAGAQWTPTTLLATDLPDLAAAGYLALTGDQSVAGTKTFASAPTFQAPLAVASGGTGASAFAPGGIVFGAADGTLAQDAPGLKWDAANGRLGVGTSAPAGRLHVVQDGSAGAAGIRVDYYGGANPAFDGRAARGSAGVPGAVQAGDILANVIGRGHDGTAFSAANAFVSIRAAETFSPTSAGTYITLETTPVGSASGRQERVRITDSGSVGIGTAAPTAALDVAGGAVNASDGLKTGGTLRIDGSGALQTGAVSADTGILTSGTLGVERGGTGTGAFTQGSVPFAGASGLSQDNANLFWDGTNRRLGIGTSSPAYRLDVSGAGSTLARLLGGAGQGAALTMGSSGNTQWTLGPGVNNLSNADDFGIGTPGDNKLVVRAGGNVGIGTTSPAFNLVVASSAVSANIAVVDSGDSFGRRAQLGHSDTNGGSLILWNDAGALNVDLSSYGSSYLNGGNVGIGASVPATNLHVRRTESADNSLFEVARFAVLDSSQTNAERGLSIVAPTRNMSAVGLRKSGTGSTFVIQDDSAATQLAIAAGGYVGVGTTSPGSLLELSTPVSDAATLRLSERNTASGYGGGVVWSGYYNGTTTPFDAMAIKRMNLDDNNAADLAQRLGFLVREPVANGSLKERMSVLQDGKVGVGTTTPSAQLHVGSGASGQSPYGNTLLAVENANRAIISLLTPKTNDSYLMFGNPDAANRAYVGYLGSGMSPADQMIFRTSGSFTFSGGYVGIGTTSPSALLEVNGGIRTSGTNQSIGVRYSNGNDNYLTSLNWNPGIGGILTLGNNGANEIRAGRTNPNGMLSIYVNNTAAETDATNGTLSMTLAANGNVGVGTASPGGRLEVAAADGSLASPGAYPTQPVLFVNDFAGDGPATDNGVPLVHIAAERISTGDANAANARVFQISADNGATLLVRGNGNVGIGTTSPAAKLDVNGALKVGGSETGTAANDIRAYIQSVACQNRRGVWVDGTGCQEYAYFTGQCTFGSCSCAAGHHMCSIVDLLSGGFASLRRPGYSNPMTYAWMAGTYVGDKDKFFYPWGQGGSTLQCSAGAHYMIDTRREAAGNTAWGCYVDSYGGASAACCRDNQ